MKLSIVYNRLTTIHRQALENCTKLEELHLRHNQIENVHFLHRISSSSFRYLNLRVNAIDYFNASYHLRGIKTIKRLYLNSNQLRDESFTFSSNDNSKLSHLEEIDLTDNQLQMMPHFEIAPYLKKIDLASNDLYSFPSNSSIGLVKDVVTLYLGMNAISHTPSTSMWGPFYALKTLDLKSNNLQSIDKNFMLAFPNIDYLNVKRNAKLNQLPNCTPVGMSLRCLKAFNCGLTKVLADHLREMRALETMNLAQNQLRYFPTEVLVMMKNLQALNLGGNYLIGLQDPTENGPMPQSNLVIQLQLNPFVCDRRICWILNNRNANISFDLTSVQCDQPEAYRTRNLQELQSTNICQGKCHEIKIFEWKLIESK